MIFASQKETWGIGLKANIIENHDEPRGASRFLPEYAHNETGAKMLATTFLFLYGIPFIYQGQEIGMTNCRRGDISEYDDISTKDQYREALQAGCTREQALECCYENSRDNARTPMQWSSEKNAGFTSGTPWLAVNPDYKKINVAEQERRKDSVLSYYKKLIALKKSPQFKEVLTYGKFIPEYEDSDSIFAYHRISEESGQNILVAANYGESTCEIPLECSSARVLLSNIGKEKEIENSIPEKGKISLESCRAAVLLLEK